MDEYCMARKVLMAELSGVWVQGRHIDLVGRMV